MGNEARPFYYWDTIRAKTNSMSYNEYRELYIAPILDLLYVYAYERAVEGFYLDWIVDQSNNLPKDKWLLAPKYTSLKQWIGITWFVPDMALMTEFIPMIMYGSMQGVAQRGDFNEMYKLWDIAAIVYDGDPEFNFEAYQYYSAREMAARVWAKTNSGTITEQWLYLWMYDNQDKLRLNVNWKPEYGPHGGLYYYHSRGMYGGSRIWNYVTDESSFLSNGDMLYFEYGIPVHKYPFKRNEDLIRGPWLYFDYKNIYFTYGD